MPPASPATPADALTARNGTRFRDLNGNGTMEPYEDPRLPTAERVADLVARLSLAEKAGLMFHTQVVATADGQVSDVPIRPGRAGAAGLVGGKLITHLNVTEMPGSREMARWQNALQELAARSPHGIPVTLSTDPRHGFEHNAAASFAAAELSAWPDQIGFAAIGDADLVRRFGDVARREYLALGIRAALHPSIDLATEPRWARQYTTFGQDGELAGRLVVAYLEGFQGAALGPGSVACVTKHFPGGGPQRDGEDPHFPYGREQVYPGGRFDEHLAPFRAAIAAGTAGLMPYYGIPVGLELAGEPVEEIGFGFNRQIITGLLRERLGYDGVVCSDWGLVTDALSRDGSRGLPARAWGAEELTARERVRRIVAAGCDQLGGEECVEILIDLVESGDIPESRIDESARRLLAVKFDLGLFDDPFVSEDEAAAVVGAPRFVAEGLAAQARAMVALTPLDALPARRARLHLDGLDPAAATGGTEIVADPRAADLVVVRIAAPWEERDAYMLESGFHAGSLEFAAADVARILALAEMAPTALVVRLDRPAILTPFLDAGITVLAEFGACDRAVLDVVLGVAKPEGRLPFDVPRSMAAVETSLPDVPGDTADALFRAGYAASSIAGTPRT
ncbi:glycoside hydrolase family 3 N-terminal domain-containing protein [Nonomuraea sp. NPDC050643]|uniref:glycoside hydrolase family 3 protein n=1 Tax=Nonomuraea sp. NPDC050643 TaxID=3155660 RepID=UPI0033F15885